MGISSQKLDALHLGAIRTCITLGFVGIAATCYVAYEVFKDKPEVALPVKDETLRDTYSNQKRED